MGSSGDTPRKPRHRLARTKYAEANNIQLAGLAESSEGPSGTRLGHNQAHKRAQDLGTFQRFFLWCLGRRRTKMAPADEVPTSHVDEEEQPSE
jgi:hypothetical protein